MLFKVKLHKIDLTYKTCFCCRLDGVFQAILRRKWPRYPNGSYGRRNFTPFNGIYRLIILLELVATYSYIIITNPYWCLNFCRLQFLQSSWQKTKKRKNYFYSRTIGCARVPIFQNQISRYIHARRSGFENQFARIKSTGNHFFQRFIFRSKLLKKKKSESILCTIKHGWSLR